MAEVKLAKKPKKFEYDETLVSLHNVYVMECVNKV